MTKKTLKHRIKLRATPPQHEFLTSSHRTTAFIAGVGSGKTYASTIKALAMPPNTTGMIVAPTYDMAKTISVTTLLEIAEPLIANYNKADLEIQLIDNKQIYFRSADRPDRLRGPNLNWVALDEARDIHEQAYLIALGRVRRPPEKLWVTTTPRPRTWLRNLANDPETHTIRATTMTNPHLSEDYLNSLKHYYGEGSDFYRQEVLGEFVDFTGAVYQNPTRYDGPPPLGRSATGCDFAYTHNDGDWTVFVEGIEAEGIIYLTGMYRAQTDATIWASVLTQYPNPTAIIGGQEKGVAAFLRKDYEIDVNTKRAVTDKKARSVPVAAAWNRGQIQVPSDGVWVEDFLAELTAFTGDAKRDDHDDVPDALAALHLALIGTPPASIRSGGWT